MPTPRPDPRRELSTIAVRRSSLPAIRVLTAREGLSTAELISRALAAYIATLTPPERAAVATLAAAASASTPAPTEANG